MFAYSVQKGRKMLEKNKQNKVPSQKTGETYL